MSYCIYAKGKLTKEQIKKADTEIKSGLLEMAYDDIMSFHNLNKEDITPAFRLLNDFGFETKPEIYEEIFFGCTSKEVDVTDKIVNEMRVDDLFPRFHQVIRDFDPYSYDDNDNETINNERKILEEDPLWAVEILVSMLSETLERM